MKMNTQRIRMAVMLFLGILLAPLSLQAQDVNVRANNGSCLPAVKGDGATDAFYSLGGFALWKHNQLNLNMTTADSDGAAMLSNGQFANPANNIFKADDGVNLVLGRGKQLDCYVAFTLPKGYRFTGYTIVFRRNVNKGSGDSGQASFGEVTPSNWGNWRFPTNNETFKTGLSYSTSAAKQTITRTSTSSDDMDNTLYFKLTNSQNGDNYRAFISFESINLEFTAEGDYTPVTPAGVFLNRTAVDIPFSTSCVDLGSIENRLYNGVTRMSYSYENVKDLMANLTLYQADATEDGTHFDGTTGKVVKYANGGTITSNGDYFQIGAAGETENIYYLETPTYVELNNDEKSKTPIAYRIIGAEIKYTYGEARDAHQEIIGTETVLVEKSYPTFTISCQGETYSRTYQGIWPFGEYVYTSNGVQTYYLTSSAGMSTNASDKAEWFMDDDGYIRLANDPTKYLKNQRVSNTNNRMAIVGSGDSPAKYAINANGQITLAANANMYLCLNVSNYNNTNYAETINYFQMIQNGDTKATRTLTGENKTLDVYEEQPITLDYPAFTPSEYTLNLYDKTGTTVAKSIKVTSTTPDGSLKLDLLNNDAVKIGVVGVGLIEGTLTLQAIDPYIDQMTVECADAAVGKENIKIEQDFYASDFSVNGGEFHFYLPEQCAADGDYVKITFKDLYSNYADETYEEHHPNETHYSRYSFVKSAHFNAFGTTTNNIYSNVSEAADPQLERLKVSTVGTVPFTFNNAAEVGTNGGTLMDYPFTLQNYEGTFEELTIPVTTAVQTRTRYVFTTDETAYNIAPTTAIQHRSYAFYKIVVNIHAASYTPEVEFVPVYSETLHGTGQTDAFYGAVITAPYQEGGKTKQGFVSTDVIYQIIDGAAKATAASGTIKDEDNNTIGTYTNKDGNLSSAKQLLYLDYSQLAGLYQSASSTHTMGTLGADYATNCMVFVPAGTAAQVANVVSKTDAEGLFLAARDVILTDKEPFYSPYTIRVDAARRIEYKRQITKDGYGKVQNATIILPFAIALENGKHTNLDGTYFTLHQMQKDKAIALNGDKPYAYFPQELADVTRTEPHTPYLVNLEESQNSTEDGISFVVTQAGGTLYPTTGAKTQGGYNYFFDGETATGIVVASGGTYPAGTYTFHNQGTYAGQAIEKTKGVFYFARNRFVNSSELSNEITTVKIAPFRTYYTVTAPSGAKMAAIDVIFGEGIGDEPDGINDLDNDIDLSVKAGNGTLTIASKVDNNVRINGINGVARYNLGMKAGEVKTVNVPAGLYIVNGVKILVK